MTNESTLNNDAEQPKHLIPLISDYGFKVSFATDSLFSRKAIQVLIDSDTPIQHLDMSRNEFEGISIESRSGLYDIICRDERMRVFIVEMQVDNYTAFIQRLLFYAFHMYCSVVSKGKMGFLNLPTIY
jgi:predicted transposase/invertase (TIGR01784 family)